MQMSIPSETTAAPLRSVRLGRQVTAVRWPGLLDGPQRLAKKLAWTAVEARRVRTPIRYAASELLTKRRGDYHLRDEGSRFSVRHGTGDVHIFRKFYAYGYYELPPELSASLSSLGRAVRVLDLGANIGFFEVFTRSRLEIDEVVCFEPDPANAAMLERTREANGGDWRIVKACASNRDGRARFVSGRQNFSGIGAGGDTEVATIDVFPYLAGADLVKMNIEGAEWEILMDDRFDSISANWIVEYHRIFNPEPDIHALARRLFEQKGYSVRVVNASENNGLLWAWRP
jgi:FkbM family methyltransferase